MLRQIGWLVGWGLTALLTQNRSYRACRFVGIFYSRYIYPYAYIYIYKGISIHMHTYTYINIHKYTYNYVSIG